MELPTTRKVEASERLPRLIQPKRIETEDNYAKPRVYTAYTTHRGLNDKSCLNSTDALVSLASEPNYSHGKDRVFVHQFEAINDGAAGYIARKLHIQALEAQDATEEPTP